LPRVVLLRICSMVDLLGYSMVSMVVREAFAASLSCWRQYPLALWV